MIGTGFAARLRAEALQEDERAQLVAVVGHRASQTKSFASEFGATAYSDWSALLHEARLDLVLISTINRDHAPIARAALNLGLHVVVEYPLALSSAEARALVALAESKNLLLHVEHIELLSGVHEVLRRELGGLGDIFAVNYATLTTARPAPERWTYDLELFGFPLMGAVSRLHRLINLFGPVTSVSCQCRYEGSQLPQRYSSCYCTATLTFASGLVGSVTYGKGESIWRSQRTIEVHGHRGALLIDNEQAILLRPDGAHPLDGGSRRGLFGKDTRMVIDHLLEGHPLYVEREQMLHALEVAEAAEKSADRQQVVSLTSLQA